MIRSRECPILIQLGTWLGVTIYTLPFHQGRYRYSSRYSLVWLYREGKETIRCQRNALPGEMVQRQSSKQERPVEQRTTTQPNSVAKYGKYCHIDSKDEAMFVSDLNRP